MTTSLGFPERPSLELKYYNEQLDETIKIKVVIDNACSDKPIKEGMKHLTKMLLNKYTKVFLTCEGD